jgi:hypothetical protein
VRFDDGSLRLTIPKSADASSAAFQIPHGDRVP